MKNFTGKILLALAAVLLCFGFHSQAGNPSLKRLIIVSGGVYGAAGNYVKFAGYDPATGQYSVFDSVPGNFTNFAYVDYTKNGTFGYLSADSIVYKYSLDSFKKLDSVSIPGIQRMLISDTVLIVTRGYGAGKNYVQFFNKNSLKLLALDTVVNTYTDGIEVSIDGIYVGIRGSFGQTLDKGKIAVFDPHTLAFKKYLEIDSIKAISGLYYQGNVLYAASPGSNRIGMYNVKTGADSFINAKGINDFLLKDNTYYGLIRKLWYSTGLTINYLDLNTKTIDDTKAIKGSFAAAAIDYLGKNGVPRIFSTETDFFTYGKLHVMDETGTQLDSAETGISPQAIALQYDFGTGIEENTNVLTLGLYPNPAASEVNLTLPYAGPFDLSVFDISGRKIMEKHISGRYADYALKLTALHKGVYFIRLTNEKSVYTAKLLKD